MNGTPGKPLRIHPANLDRYSLLTYDVDEVAVERRIGGERVPLSANERLEVVRRLWSYGLSNIDIARRAGFHERQVHRDRERLGLPKMKPGTHTREMRIA